MEGLQRDGPAKEGQGDADSSGGDIDGLFERDHLSVSSPCQL